MRKGPKGSRDTSNEATANPYKDSLPDLMTFKDGKKVKTADDWPKRRAEIVEEFEREVYGRVPKNVPKVKWEVTKTVEGESGGIATVTRTLVGHVDNSAFSEDQGRYSGEFHRTQARQGQGCRSSSSSGAAFGGRGGPDSWTQQALDRGWGHGTINPNSIQGDNNKLREGIIGLTNKGEPRKPDGLGRVCAPGAGVSAASSTTSRPTRTRGSIRPRCASPACRATARRRSSPRPLTRRVAAGFRRLLGGWRRQAVSPRFRRTPGEPGVPRRIPLDGRQLPEIRGRGGQVRQEKRQPISRWTSTC